MIRRFVSLLAGLLFVSGTAFAAPGPARVHLNAFAQDLHSLSGNFVQTLTGSNGGTHKSSSGTMALEAPRQFRWETVSPYKQTIVADGSRVWLYDPDLDQVTVRVQSSEEAQSPLTVLTDLTQMDKDFKVVEQGEHDGLVWLRLTSNARDPQFDYADLGFDAAGLKRMVFKDQLGSTTDITFSNWQKNAALPAATFNFVPPAGADVIGDKPVISTQPLKN
jgi:outer membrane lipoprotein carrier protein